MERIKKFKTGISGLDEITHGGLPLARTTLIAGDPGCGKTLFMASILAHAAAERDEPAVLFTFEERRRDIIDNAASIGLDLQALIDAEKFEIVHVSAPREGMTEVGTYTLDGLKLRITAAMNAIGAKYLALDTVETLFSVFSDEKAIRGELVRLLNGLSDDGVTTLMSAERGDGRVTRRGFEEYVSDCVIALENDTWEDIATRRLRVIKYRGAHHRAHKYPFMIGPDGFTVMPLTSATFDHDVATDKISTGTDAVDVALQGGIRRGSTVLISGPTGSGKTILAGAAALETCWRDENALFLSFEESPEELITNLASVNFDLRRQIDAGLLRIASSRPTLMGLERHLVELCKLVEDHKPTLVVIDPVSSLSSAGDRNAVYRTIVRMIDYLKRRKITAVLTMEPSEIGDADRSISFASILDTLIDLSAEISDDGIERYIQVIKARGIDNDHRRQLFSLTSGGVEVEPDDD